MKNTSQTEHLERKKEEVRSTKIEFGAIKDDMTNSVGKYTSLLFLSKLASLSCAEGKPSEQPNAAEGL